MKNQLLKPLAIALMLMLIPLSISTAQADQTNQGSKGDRGDKGGKGQAIQAASHIHWRHRHPNLGWKHDQARHCNNSATQLADTEGESSSRYP